jgi:hypothetical protein
MNNAFTANAVVVSAQKKGIKFGNAKPFDLEESPRKTI